MVVGPRPRVLVAIDWTKLRRWPVWWPASSIAAAAVPVLWSVADSAKLHKSQNAFEHGFFAYLRAALPMDVEAAVVFDRRPPDALEPIDLARP